MSASFSAAAPLHFIVGPTGAGKSAIAMHLAQQRGLAIVSADSRQIYRAFNIGTAKPSDHDLRCVPHFGIDIVAPTERYSAHRWSNDAARWCTEARMGGREPLIVGGTGFYVRALVTPLHELPTLDVPRRAALATWLAQQDAALIEKWVERLDPARLVLGRTQHVRAIETAVIAGVRLSDALASSPAIAPAFTDVRYLVVDPGTSLRARIALRVEQMLARGWWDEVVELAASVPADAPAWNACGYGVLREAIAGTRSRDDAIQRVVIETRQYAKRQRTWNRHQLPAQHVTFLDSSAADAMTRALEWWDFSKEHIQ